MTSDWWSWWGKLICAFQVTLLFSTFEGCKCFLLSFVFSQRIRYQMFSPSKGNRFQGIAIVLRNKLNQAASCDNLPTQNPQCKKVNKQSCSRYSESSFSVTILSFRGRVLDMNCSLTSNWHHHLMRLQSCVRDRYGTCVCVELQRNEPRIPGPHPPPSVAQWCHRGEWD